LKRNFENCNKKNLFDNYHHYFPLYVGKTKNFCNRYKHFKNSLKSGATAPHVFGGDLNQFLSKSKLINSQPMKMCLVAFYTNSEDKAKCIEHFILKHPNFCKIFNDEDGNCPKIQKIKQMAKDIKNEAKKINNKSQEIIRKAEEIIQQAQEISNIAKETKDIKEKAENIKKILKTIKEKAGEIKNEAEKISNIAKETKDIKEKAENIKKILETIKEKAGKIKEEAEKISNIGKEAKNIKKKAEDIEKIIKEKSEEIINAIQIANKVIKTIQKLESCPWYL